MRIYTSRLAECHPAAKHYGKGLCERCYRAKYYKADRSARDKRRYRANRAAVLARTNARHEALRLNPLDPQKGDIKCDGFRLHRNPDGTWVFIEGVKLVPNKKEFCWTAADKKNLDECLKRRGIRVEPFMKVGAR